MATIVLRDIPKERVDLDGVSFPVGGGFRGFQNVPKGFHLITVHDGSTRYRGEALLLDDDSVAVLALSNGTLGHDSSEDGARTADLAASGAMNRALIDPLVSTKEAMRLWRHATSKIDRPTREVTFTPPVSGGDSRFAAYWAAHGGNARAALREAQAAFVRLIIDGDFNQLRYILQAHYNAGERVMAQSPAYFSEFALFVAAVLQLAPSLRAPGSAAVEGANQLAEDLRDGAGDDPEALAAVEALDRALRPTALN